MPWAANRASMRHAAIALRFVHVGLNLERGSHNQSFTSAIFAALL